MNLQSRELDIIYSEAHFFKFSTKLTYLGQRFFLRVGLEVSGFGGGGIGKKGSGISGDGARGGGIGEGGIGEGGIGERKNAFNPLARLLKVLCFLNFLESLLNFLLCFLDCAIYYFIYSLNKIYYNVFK